MKSKPGYGKGKTGHAKGRFSWRKLQGEKDSTPKGIMRESSKDLLFSGGSPLEMPKTREEWYQFTVDNFILPIPAHQVCKNHDIPLDFFIQYVTGTLEKYINIILCSREGFKTYCLAMATLTKCMFIPGWEVMHLGAIEKQAAQAYEYSKKFWAQFPHAKKFLNPDADIQTGITTLYNTSNYFIGALTEAFANSKRSGDVNVDEVDSVEASLRHLLTEDLLNVPSTRSGIPPTLIFASSLRRSNGTMDYLLENEQCIPKWKVDGTCKVWEWCYKEVTEKCENYGFPCEDYLAKSILFKVLENRKGGLNFKEQDELKRVKEWIISAKSHCALMPSCLGDLHRAAKPVRPGALRKIWGKGGVVDKYKAATERSKKAQFDNIIPGDEDTLYDPETVKACGRHGLEFDPDQFYINGLLIDWGDPTVVHLCQTGEGNIDRIVQTWVYFKLDPDKKADDIFNNYYAYDCSYIDGDSDNADMNRKLEGMGLPVQRIPFGAPSMDKKKSKLWWAAGVVEQRMENGLLEISEENSGKLLRTLRKLRNRPESKNRFGIDDDHHACALFCKYANEEGMDYHKPLHIRQSITERLDGKKEVIPDKTETGHIILFSPGESYDDFIPKLKG